MARVHARALVEEEGNLAALLTLTPHIAYPLRDHPSCSWRGATRTLVVRGSLSLSGPFPAS
eukprot:scaffold74156_cov26-Tisochrysis_lutea.AAC.3